MSLAADTVAWPTPTGPVKAYFDSIWEPRVVAVTYVQHKDGEELRSIVAVRMSAEDLRP